MWSALFDVTLEKKNLWLNLKYLPLSQWQHDSFGYATGIRSPRGNNIPNLILLPSPPATDRYHVKHPLSTSSLTRSAIIWRHRWLVVITGYGSLLGSSSAFVVSSVYMSGACAESHVIIGIMSNATPSPNTLYWLTSATILYTTCQIPSG